VVNRSGNYQSLTPFCDVAVFSDDFIETNGSCSANFNIDVMNHIEFSGRGDYYIVCSVGTFLSNIVRVSIVDDFDN
jgi:hypothetical protein